MVKQGKLPADGLVAVKYLRASKQKDIEMLIRIAKLRAPPESIPKLVFYSQDMNQFAITPVGKGMTENELASSGTFAQHALNHILNGLLWLHANNIIHRDLRLDNIIFNKAQAVIIDYGTAVNFPAGEVDYLGGFTCCPPRILSTFHQKYEPQKEDDYHAFVLLVHSVHYPYSIQQFASAKIADPSSDENARLRSFWKRLKAAALWGNFVVAAEKGETETLKEMVKMVVTMEKSVDIGHSAGAIELEDIESCRTGIAERLVMTDEE
jgi:serine/threonine protein kinase